MIENESKSRRQEASIEKWRNHKGIGTLNLVPRFGKTRIAKLTAERFIAKSPRARILAVAPNDLTAKNLINNLPGSVICVTKMYLTKHLTEYQSKEFDLIIVDEIHKFFDPNGLKILELKAKFRLGLTGAKLSLPEKVTVGQKGFPVVDVITEKEAVEKLWISPSVEYNLGIDIEDYKKDDYVNCSLRISEIITNYHDLYQRMNTIFGTKIFHGDIDLMFALYTGTSYVPQGRTKSVFIPPNVIRGELAATMGWDKDLDMSLDLNQRVNEYFNPSVLQETGRIFNDIIRERNNLIINSKNKIDTVLQIIARNPVPTIIFNESTSMANLIATALGEEAIEYHSNVASRYIKNPATGEYFTHANGNPIKFGSTRLKKLAIEGMKSKWFKYLCTAKALNEGADIPILSQVITTGGTTNPATHFQRVARGKTLFDEDPAKVTTIINIYIKDFEYNGEVIPSRDANKLKLRQKNEVVYWVDNIDEIFIDTE
jgi:superfamily II DNA or RNA helicase